MRKPCSGSYASAAPHRVKAADVVEAGSGEHDLVEQRHRAAGEAGVAALRHNREPPLAAVRQHLYDTSRRHLTTLECWGCLAELVKAVSSYPNLRTCETCWVVLGRSATWDLPSYRFIQSLQSATSQ